MSQFYFKIKVSTRGIGIFFCPGTHPGILYESRLFLDQNEYGSLCLVKQRDVYPEGY